MVLPSKGIQIRCTCLKYGKFVGSLSLRSSWAFRVTCDFACSDFDLYDVRAHIFYFYNSALTHILMSFYHCCNSYYIVLRW